MKQESLSIRIIYWFTEVTFWLYSLTGLIALGLSIAMIFGLMRDMQLNVGLPVTMDAHEVSELVLHNETMEVEMKELMGKIHFIDTPTSVTRVYGVFMMIMLATFFFIFYTFRKFIHNIRKGEFFKRSNIALLKRISYTLMFFWAFTVFYSWFQYFYIAAKLDFASMDVNFGGKFFSAVLLVALFIWVLSHIFMKGAELQEENELTV